MADFTALKTAIQNAIKQNGNEEITGNLLQEVLLAIVTTLGDGSINDLVTALGSEATTRSQADGTLQQNINAEAQARQQGDSTLQGGINTAMQAINAINNAIGNGCVYAGIATPSTTPAAGKVFYLALTAGTYTNFNGLEVSQGINILKNNGSTWSLDSFVGIDDAPAPSSQKLVKSGGVLDSIIKDGSAFDLSAYNGGATYSDLNAALTALNALPAAYKKGGMSFKFVQSSDNNYVQCRLMANAFTTNVTKWQMVDTEPTANSKNLVESGGIQKYSKNIVGLAGITQYDVKGCLNFEVGSVDQEGSDYDGSWRIRSVATKLPFPVIVKHNIGFGFRVFYFDDESMSNPQPQMWRNNTTLIQTFEIPANQYFRIVAYWQDHQSADYAINNIITSVLYNNIFVFNKLQYDDKNFKHTSIGSVDADAKYLLNLEAGGIDMETGLNYDPQQWRIRSAYPLKLPFPIAITHHIGFGFRVFYYDGADMTTATCTPQEWKNNAAIVESFTVPANQYFRIVVYWNDHQSADYNVVDLLGSEIFYGIIATNQEIIGNDYSFECIVPPYRNLSSTRLPYPNIDTLNGVMQLPIGLIVKYGQNASFYQVSSEVSVPILTSGTSALKLVFNFATQAFNFKGFTIPPSETEYVLGTIRITTKQVGTSYVFDTLVSANFPFPITIDGMEFNKEEVSLYKTRLNLPIRIAAHQGFSVTSEYYGNSRLSSYKAAGKLGFDIGETDIKWTSDNIPVCCHDNSFVDSVSGDTIVIAECTFAELETYNYYGEKLASFDEVVSTCKLYGMEIIVDHFYSSYTDEKIETIINILKKYAMLEKALFFIDKNSLNYVNAIKEYYSRARFLITAFSLTDEDINFANSIVTDDNIIYLTLYYVNNTPEVFIQNAYKLAGGVSFGVWTVDDLDILKTYLPYASILITNKIRPCDVISYLGKA